MRRQAEADRDERKARGPEPNGRQKTQCRANRHVSCRRGCPLEDSCNTEGSAKGS